MDSLLPTAEDAIEFEAEQSLLSQSETLQRLHQTFGDAIPTRGPPAGNAPATASATASRKSNAGRPPKKPSNVGSIKWDAFSIQQKRDLIDQTPKRGPGRPSNASMLAKGGVANQPSILTALARNSAETNLSTIESVAFDDVEQQVRIEPTVYPYPETSLTRKFCLLGFR